MSALISRAAALRLTLGSVLVVLFVGLRDVGQLSVKATLVLCGAVSAAALALLLAEAALASIPRREWFGKWLRVPAVLAMFVIPGAHGFPAYWEARESLPWFTPIALLVGAVVACGLVAFVRLPLGFDRARWTLGTVFTSTTSALLLHNIHEGTGTLQDVRPGTGLTHVGMFVGTWIASAVFSVAWTTRFAGPLASDKGRRALIAGGVFVICGVLAAEVDRRALADLYEDLHLWLGVLALLMLEAGVRLLTALRTARAWTVAGAVGAALLVVCTGVAATRSADFAAVSIRTELRRSPIGASFLYVAPRPSGKLRPEQFRHPALEHDRYLDARRSGPPLNVLLVTIDAWRYDSVGFEETPLMPNLEAMADAEGVRFNRAYAQGNRTAIAMSAMMLGRYSANIDWNLWYYRGGRIFDKAKLSEKELEALKGKAVNTTMPVFHEGRMLAERLRAKGYHTIATPYASKNEFFRPGVGFDHGIDDFADLSDEDWKVPTTKKVIGRALKQRKAIPKGKPWFHWIHLYDPHQAGTSQAKYKKLLKQTDEGLDELFDDLKKKGQWDKTIVIFVADHGEAFGEHNGFNHGSTLYDEQIRVPLIIKVPGIAPRVEDVPVAAIDIAATLCAMSGADTAELDGVNLWPLIESNRYPESRPIFSELHRYVSRQNKRTGDMKAIVWEGHKLIVNRQADTAELYDLQADPGELNNLLTERRETYERHYDLLDKFVSGGEAEHPLP